MQRYFLYYDVLLYEGLLDFDEVDLDIQLDGVLFISSCRFLSCERLHQLLLLINQQIQSFSLENVFPLNAFGDGGY